jgi:hypothetical protein
VCQEIEGWVVSRNSKRLNLFRYLSTRVRGYGSPNHGSGRKMDKAEF